MPVESPEYLTKLSPAYGKLYAVDRGVNIKDKRFFVNEKLK